MKLSPDDPRLTAYALHELPPDEAARIEAALADHPEARAALEETRALAALLQEGLAAESEAGLAPDLADAVRQRLADPGSPSAPPNVVEFPRRRVRWMPWLGLAAAAAMLVAAASLFFPKPRPVLHLVSAPPPSAAPAVPAPQAPADVGAVAASNPLQAPPPTPVPGTLPSAPSGPPTIPSDTPRSAASAPAATTVTIPVAPSVPRVPTSGRGALATASGNRLPSTKAEATQGPVPVAQDARSRYGLATAVTPPGNEARDARVQPPNAPNPTVPTRSPDLMRRYALAPAPAPTAAGASASQDRYLRESLANDTLNLASAAPPSSLRGLAIAPAPPGTVAPMPVLVPEGRVTVWSLESREPANNPGYIDLGENPFRAARDEPLSTFSLDVDTGSYPNIRRFLNAGQLPRPEAVRLEEMLNYFRYEAPPVRGDHPFGVGAEVATCPWSPDARLVRLVIQARELSGPRAAGNFVFLVDVSGSMQPPERLPLLKQALKALVRRLAPSDRIAIVTYASSAGVHLPSTSGEDRETLLAAIDRLQSGGSTHGEGGIRAAYDVARAHFIPGGVNRVLLCTDGDFNVGVSDQNQLVDLVADQARSGVFLTTLGVGTDNFKDALMRRLADRGNGSYHYLDSFEEAQRVLVQQMDATFVTVARDVKAQVEFNPSKVGAWRLLGYEKRALAHQDFNDDTKDAGEIGAGHQVTVLYEILPPGHVTPAGVDPLKYQRPVAAPAPARELVESSDLFTLKLRYQKPEGSRSTLLEVPVADGSQAWSRASADFRFAAAVASFGMLLRGSPHRGTSDYASVLDLARGALGRDPDGWRAEFLALVRKAQELSRGPQGTTYR